MKRNQETPRKVYVTDEQFALSYSAAPPWLQDAMDLALGRRPAHGCASRCVGRFKDAMERVLGRTRKVRSIYLVADDKGQRITVDRMQKAFLRARRSMTWQFRDIRKKTATDVDELRGAQRLLGHANEMTTARVYRQVKGEKVKPLR